jgi:hypothetical protein
MRVIESRQGQHFSKNYATSIRQYVLDPDSDPLDGIHAAVEPMSSRHDVSKPAPSQPSLDIEIFMEPRRTRENGCDEWMMDGRFWSFVRDSTPLPPLFMLQP